VDPYVTALTAFLGTLHKPIRLVDLGCGDLGVGRRLMPIVDEYIGCDVVPQLIDEHRRSYSGEGVRFSCLDLTEDELPAGDVATVRQVLQHLSNDQIRSLLPKLAAYRFVIVTEHVPRGDFLPNLDKGMGPGTRLVDGSGVVLGKAPFGLPDFVGRLLCSVEADDGVIETRIYSRRE
jgi:hypothetical protein